MTTRLRLVILKTEITQYTCNRMRGASLLVSKVKKQPVKLEIIVNGRKMCFQDGFENINRVCLPDVQWKIITIY